ncbi:hypothetical protein ACWEKT_35675 [Nocardia takedensis]
MVGEFSVFGYHVTGSRGVLFLYGIVVGAVAMLGLSVPLAGARRNSRRARPAHRELEYHGQSDIARDDVTACHQPDGLYPQVPGRISRVRGDTVWPCLTRAGSAVELALESNSGPAWLVSTTPAWTVNTPTSFDPANILALAAWRTMSPDAAKGRALLLPAEKITLTGPEVVDTRVEMAVDPVLSQVRAVGSALSVFIPEETAENLGRASCLPDLLDSGAVTEQPSAAGLGAIARCFGAAAGGAVGALIGVVGGGTGALWTEIEGLLRTVTGTDEIAFEVAALPTESGGAPIDAARVSDLLGTWTGPVDQRGSRDYSVILSLRHDGRTVAYPELRCSGYLHRAELVGDALRIQETISKNGSCVVEVGLELKLDRTGLAYYFGQRTGQNQEGTALLTRMN